MSGWTGSFIAFFGGSGAGLVGGGVVRACGAGLVVGFRSSEAFAAASGVSGFSSLLSRSPIDHCSFLPPGFAALPTGFAFEADCSLLDGLESFGESGVLPDPCDASLERLLKPLMHESPWTIFNLDSLFFYPCNIATICLH